MNNDLRRRIVQGAYEHGLPHSSSSLSCVDAIAHLYDNVMTDQDGFILSKGHGALALYAVLEKQGLKPTWQMHPDYDPEKGIMATTGSLGHGLPLAVGRAFARKRCGAGRMYVLLGDCETMEGSNWEALALADALKVDLTVLVDANGHGVLGDVGEYGLSPEVIAKRLEAFGCSTLLLNGHEEKDLRRIGTLESHLQGVVLKTVRGKGVPVLEGSDAHHYYWNKNETAYQDTMRFLSQ